LFGKNTCVVVCFETQVLFLFYIYIYTYVLLSYIEPRSLLSVVDDYAHNEELRALESGELAMTLVDMADDLLPGSHERIAQAKKVLTDFEDGDPPSELAGAAERVRSRLLQELSGEFPDAASRAAVEFQHQYVGRVVDYWLSCSRCIEDKERRSLKKAKLLGVKIRERRLRRDAQRDYRARRRFCMGVLPYREVMRDAQRAFRVRNVLQALEVEYGMDASSEEDII
jgi:hypothetical protein